MKSREIIAWILSGLLVLVTIIIYQDLPQQIPYHWDINGDVSYGARHMIWMMALLPLFCNGLLYLLPKIDPRNENYIKFKTYYEWVRLSLTLFFIGMFAVTLVETFSPGTFNLNVIVPFLVGMLFLILGNMMPKFKSNFFMGIRTPWTLSDENVWNKTHRLGGMLFVIGGLVMMIGSVCFMAIPWVLYQMVLVVALSCSMIPVVMSYVWYRKIGKK